MRAVLIALAAVTIDVIGFGIVMPVLPRLVTELGHVGVGEAAQIGGWLLAAFAVAQFFAGPVVGQLGDRYGRRPVLVLSMFAFAIDYALMARAPSLAWLFAGRVIAGLAGATYGPAGAVIADTTPPDRRAAVYGLLGAAFGIGFMLGPALGGLVAGLGTRAPFLVAGGFAAVNAAAMILLLPETLAAKNRRPFHLRDAHVVGSFRPLFAAGNAAPLIVAWFLLAARRGRLSGGLGVLGDAALRLGRDCDRLVARLGRIPVGPRPTRPHRPRGEAARGGQGGRARARLRRGDTGRLRLYGPPVVGLRIPPGGGARRVRLSGALGTRQPMVPADRQGALQGGLSSINSVAAVIGPVMAAQVLAAGAARGFDGAAFLLAGALMAAAAIVLVAAPRLAGPAAMGEPG